MAEPYLTAPRHWRWATLAPDPDGEVISQVDCGGTPRTIVTANWDGGIPWLTPKEITGTGDTIFIAQTERTISARGLKSCSAHLLPPGTVMLTKRAPIGHVVINVVPMATSQGFLNFRCGRLLAPLYLAYWLRVNKSYLELVANGTMYPELHQGDLFEFQIALPPLAEQQAILRVIKALQYLVNSGELLVQTLSAPAELLNLQERMRHVRELRDQLITMLLSGTLSVGDARQGLEGVGSGD